MILENLLTSHCRLISGGNLNGERGTHKQMKNEDLLESEHSIITYECQYG
jgi:hypothetical protein